MLSFSVKVYPIKKTCSCGLNIQTKFKFLSS